MKLKVIILRGPMGVGKTSVAHFLADELSKDMKRLAYLPIDVSIYPFMRTYLKLPTKERREIKQETLEIVFKNFLKRKFNVIIDGIFYERHKNESSLERIIRIAKEYKTEIIIFEFHAHLETLHKRVSERKKQNPYAWENPKDTEDRYSKFMKTRHKEAITIHTEDKSPHQIVKEILKRLK